MTGPRGHGGQDGCARLSCHAPAAKRTTDGPPTLPSLPCSLCSPSSPPNASPPQQEDADHQGQQHVAPKEGHGLWFDGNGVEFLVSEEMDRALSETPPSSPRRRKAVCAGHWFDREGYKGVVCVEGSKALVKLWLLACRSARRFVRRGGAASARAVSERMRRCSGGERRVAPLRRFLDRLTHKPYNGLFSTKREQNQEATQTPDFERVCPSASASSLSLLIPFCHLHEGRTQPHSGQQRCAAAVTRA